MAFTDYLIPITSEEAASNIDPTEKKSCGISLLDKIKERNSPYDENGNFDIQKYFHIKGWHISQIGDCEVNSCIFPLAVEMAEAYEECRSFYKFLRSTITKKQFHFIYNLTEHTEREKTSILSLSRRMYESGVLLSFSVKNVHLIFATLSEAPRVINWINGTYLELYALKKTLDVIDEILDYYDCKYDVFPNTFITNGKQKHELDILFYVDNIVFWGEIKSGKFNDYNQYREMGLEIGVNPNRHILLSAEISDGDAESVGWFYECYVSNINTYSTKLKEMIELALTRKGE